MGKEGNASIGKENTGKEITVKKITRKEIMGKENVKKDITLRQQIYTYQDGNIQDRGRRGKQDRDGRAGITREIGIAR